MTDAPPNSHGKKAFVDHGLKAKKSFGQCFLADQNIAHKIALRAKGLDAQSAVEIGAGTGSLTRWLLAEGLTVVAIERDRDLIPILNETFSDYITSGQLEIVEADATAVDWSALLESRPGPHVVVGNVPYQITGRLLRIAGQHARAFSRVVFMVQKEVAQRMSAPVSSSDYSLLSVFTQRAFQIREQFLVPATCFRPQPKVQSTVVVLEPHTREADESRSFEQVVVHAFAHRRKTLRNNLKGLFGVPVTRWEAVSEQLGLNLDGRAQDLSHADFERLAKAIDPFRSGEGAHESESPVG